MTRWWVGVLAPGAAPPRDTFYASTGDPLPWHTSSAQGPSPDGSYSGQCVTINDDYDQWWAWDCAASYRRNNWICESFPEPKEAFCPTKEPCKNAFPEAGMDGFCSDVSWVGGDCRAHNSKGVPLCPFYEDGFPVGIPGKSCTCCKECLDSSCASKGPSWSCVNYATSLSYPPGSCVSDDSCKKPGNKDILKGNCAL